MSIYLELDFPKFIEISDDMIVQMDKEFFFNEFLVSNYYAVKEVLKEFKIVLKKAEGNNVHVKFVSKENSIC